MTNILIRDIPEDVASALTEKAQAVAKDRMTYIRDLLIKDASEPLVKDHYAFRFVSDLASGTIRRLRDQSVIEQVTSLSPEGSQVIAKVKTLMQRNKPGDREEAIHLLKCHFRDVFELPA